MILDSLSVLDFRVFSGAHNFDLIPKIKRGKNAPIILFGGLNGGGKTTILSALKLALYGKGVLGAGATTSEYQEYLRDCIHRASNSIVKPSRAAVELSFRYAQHGSISSYHLVRDWYVDRGDKVKEGLLIQRNGEPLSELSYDQAQSFLNELIPIGVSELFFFDGEKISKLAEETSGEGLRESINKLLGLDVIDRLQSDLSVLLRTRSVKKANKDRIEKISHAELEYQKKIDELNKIREDIVVLRASLAETLKQSSKVEAAINSRGGAWSASRQTESANLDALLIEKHSFESILQDMVSGLLPLSITKRLNEKLLAQLEHEQLLSRNKYLNDYLDQQQPLFIAELEAALSLPKQHKKILVDIYKKALSFELDDRKEDTQELHQLSDVHRARIEHRLLSEAPALQARVRDLVLKLQAIDSAINSTSENIARAPDEDLLIPLFTEQGSLKERFIILQEQKSTLVDSAKTILNQLAQLAKRLDELHAEDTQSHEDERLNNLALSAKDTLKEFSVRARVSKLKELEAQFFLSFNGLARKEDRHLSIRIDPENFEVNLIDDQGSILRKSELSAGEKQIFAISILEALARTSGRSLPVVIDTPLGRLDSIHRKKLIENYFPKTSHQVVILSTDTEVDRAFYEGLKENISHSYHLVYSEEDRSTTVEEGYFWRWADNV